jgi:hypothetical protein
MQAGSGKSARQERVETWPATARDFAPWLSFEEFLILDLRLMNWVNQKSEVKNHE